MLYRKRIFQLTFFNGTKEDKITILRKLFDGHLLYFNVENLLKPI